MPKNTASSALSALWKEYEEYLEPGNKDQSDKTIFSTGLLGLDRAIGHGLNRGIIQILGDEATGKTTLALQILATNQKNNTLTDILLPDGNAYNAVFMDLEHTYDKAYAEAVGVDTAKLLVLEMPYAEAQFNVVEELLVAGIKFVIIDSIAMVIPKSEEDKDLNDNAKVAGEAGLIGRALKRMNALSFTADALVLMINQYRSNMSPMAMTEKKPYGARIIKHVVKATIELVRTKREADRMEIQAFVAKNKMGAIGQKIKYEIAHGYGIDVYQHVFLLAHEYEIIEKSGTWWYYPSKYEAQYKGQGDQNAIKNFPMEEIQQKVIECMEKDNG